VLELEDARVELELDARVELALDERVELLLVVVVPE